MSKLNGLVEQYADALQQYLNGAGEEALRHGYEFGRQALNNGLGGLELTKIHREALLRILKETPPSNQTIDTIQRAYDFLAESLSSFEMTHRGFLDALSTLRISEERYRTLVESARDVIYTLSREGTITSLNPAFERITGWEINDWLGKSFVPLVHPEDLQQALQSFTQVIQGESPPTFELRILTKSGSYIVTEFTKTPRKREGEIIGALGIARDVTERKKNEAQIRRSEEIFRLITENAGDLIAVVDLQGKREYNSPSYGQLLGEPTELRGTDSFKDIHPDDREEIRHIFLETIRTGVGQRAEYRLMTKDGSVRYIESQGSVIRDESGRVANVLVFSKPLALTAKQYKIKNLKASFDVATVLISTYIL
ncbi:MAG: PAS domain S-box protein [Ignavibacteriae bacterium]|nr:PAS domain S-box protein [Ignavibacteriota bacterium]